MSTAVVTGGAGFLGSHLTDFLIRKGYRVICVDNLETGSLQNVEHLRGDQFLFVNHDLTRHIDIEEPVDVVYHLDVRSEEHTSELQSRGHLVCRLLLEKKKSQPW